MMTAVEKLSGAMHATETVSVEYTNVAGGSIATEAAGGACPLQGGSWRGSSDPLESPNYEEAMRRWVEEGGFRSQGPEDTHQSADDLPPPLVRLATADSRKQVLESACEYLVGLLGGAGTAASKGAEVEAGGRQVSDGEGELVDLGLDQLMQIIPALTELCDADMAADVDTSGLLDETQGMRLLGGVCRVLAPVDESVVWLSDLSKNALSDTDMGSNGEGLELGLPLDSSRGEEIDRLVPGGSKGFDHPGKASPTGGPPVASEPGANRAAACRNEMNPKSDVLQSDVDTSAVEQVGRPAIRSSMQGTPIVGARDAARDDVAAQGNDIAAQADDDGAEELADVAQVEVAVELVRLGVAILTTTEQLAARRKGTWAALAGDKTLHATLARVRLHLGGLSTAFGRVQKLAKRPVTFLACLVGLCEELGSAGFGVSYGPDAILTGGSVADVGKEGEACGSGGGLHTNREETTTENGGAGLMSGEPGSNSPADDQLTGLHGGDTDGRDTGSEGRGRNADDLERVSDRNVGGSRGAIPDEKKDGRNAGEEAPSDGGRPESPAESAPQLRSGRKRKAPFAWWESAPAAGGTAAKSDQKGRKSASTGARDGSRPSDSVPPGERSSEPCLETAEEAGVAIGEEGAEIDLEEEEVRYDKRSKRRRKVLSYKRRKAQARAPSQNRFVAYAIEEQMLDSESEWDSDQYSDLEDFIAIENEDVDFKTMPLSTITPYVPYGEEDEIAGTKAQGGQEVGSA